MKLIHRYELKEGDRVLCRLEPNYRNPTDITAERNQADLVIVVEPNDYTHWAVRNEYNSAGILLYLHVNV